MFFIAMEGPNFVGKTEIGRRLAILLGARYMEEPTMYAHGREALRLRKEEKFEEALEHYVKDRWQHLDRDIFPLLRQGQPVVCSRWFYSTLVYQMGVGLPTQMWFEQLPELIQRLPHVLFPHATILLLASEKTLRERRALRAEQTGEAQGRVLSWARERYALLSGGGIHTIHTDRGKEAWSAEGIADLATQIVKAQLGPFMAQAKTL